MHGYKRVDRQGEGRIVSGTVINKPLDNNRSVLQVLYKSVDTDRQRDCGEVSF